MRTKAAIVGLSIVLALTVILGLVYTYSRPQIEDFEMFDRLKNGLVKAKKHMKDKLDGHKASKSNKPKEAPEQ